jgi:preprotein translocase subunit YajC
MINFAWAAEQTQQPSALVNFIPFILVFVVFYFLLIRPQQKKAKQHQDYLTKLTHGDQVVTSSGIYGTVKGITDAVVTLEIADNVRVKVLKSSVAASAAPGVQTKS